MRLNEQAVLAMLKTYLSHYNNRNYQVAAGFLSRDVEGDCGGRGRLASALATNHQIEQIDYDVTAVRAWGPDDPDMADVTTVERYGGQSYSLKLGLAFVFDRGGWKLGILYPLGAGAFC